MQTSNPDLVTALIIGTILMIVLTVFIFLFVIIYQKRMIKHQVQLQKIQSDRQRELMEAVFETQENERKRLAEDLHDSVGQVLSAIKLNIHRLDRQLENENKGNPKELLHDTQTLVEDCIVEIRNIIRNILPPVLTDFGVGEALHDLSVKVGAITGIKVTFDGNAQEIKLKKEEELLLYRIVQELFNNAIKHSGASEINLTVSQTISLLMVIFKDNGRGFEFEGAKRGFGLKNMESRVQMLKGELKVITNPGSGTQTEITINLD